MAEVIAARGLSRLCHPTDYSNPLAGDDSGSSVMFGLAVDEAKETHA